MKAFASLCLCALAFLLSACRPHLSAAQQVAANATANPALVATAQADQYWRDAQATTQSYQVTLEANYQHVRATAQAATSTAQWQQAQSTATTQAQQTRDTLELSLTAGAATSQAQATADSATAQAVATGTALARQSAQATSTAAAEATAASFAATRQAFELEQARSQARREQIITAATTALLIFTGVLAVGLAAWFFWKVAPTLINRAALVRYGQHGNPLLLLGRDGRTVITDPLRMLQAALTIDEEGEVVMPELTPNQLQTLITGGVLRTLIEQTHHAPGHPPQLPAELIRERRAGPFASVTTTRHAGAPAPYRPINPSAADSAQVGPSLPALPGSVSWHTLASYPGPGLALGLGSQAIISLDLARTPHILLSGSSGSGKTRRALRPLVAQALARGLFVILLNESGSDYSPFYDHPNAAVVYGDSGTYTAVLEAALGEMSRREAILRSARVSEWGRLPDYRRDGPSLLIVIDEVLSLAMLMPPPEQKAFWSLLSAYASRARKLGMGSVGALTDPTYRVLGAGLNWREQCSARITFQVAKAAVSRAVLDAGGAEALAEGQFLAMLGRPGLVQGIAAHPTDDELLDYLNRHPATPLPEPIWLAQLAPQPPRINLPPVTTSPQPPIPVVTGTTTPTGQQPAYFVEEQPVVQPPLPFDANRPPNPAETTYIQDLYATGLSKNAICRQVYGFKDGRTFGYVRDAIDLFGEADEES